MFPLRSACALCIGCLAFGSMSAQAGERVAFSAVARAPDLECAYRAVAMHGAALVGREPELHRPPRSSEAALAPTSRGRRRARTPERSVLPLLDALDARPRAVPDRWRVVEELGL